MAVTAERDAARADLATASAERDTARANLAVALQHETAAKDEMAASDSKLREVAKELEGTKVSLDVARAEVSALATDLGTVKTELQTETQQRQDANATVDRLKQELDELRATSVGLGRQLALQQARAQSSEKQQQALKKTIDSLEKAVADAEKDNDADNAAVSALRRTLEDTKQQLNVALEDGQQASNSVIHLQSQVRTTQSTVRTYLALGSITVAALLGSLVWIFLRRARQRGQKWIDVANDIESLGEGSVS